MCIGRNARRLLCWSALCGNRCATRRYVHRHCRGWARGLFLLQLLVPWCTMVYTCTMHTCMAIDGAPSRAGAPCATRAPLRCTWLVRADSFRRVVAYVVDLRVADGLRRVRGGRSFASFEFAATTGHGPGPYKPEAAATSSGSRARADIDPYTSPPRAPVESREVDWRRVMSNGLAGDLDSLLE